METTRRDSKLASSQCSAVRGARATIEHGRASSTKLATVTASNRLPNSISEHKLELSTLRQDKAKEERGRIDNEAKVIKKATGGRMWRRTADLSNCKRQESRRKSVSLSHAGYPRYVGERGMDNCLECAVKMGPVERLHMYGENGKAWV